MKDVEIDLAEIDFALNELPGAALHAALRGFRERGPVQPTKFLGIPCFVITEHAALARAFTDDARFPGHLMYANSFAPAIGESFISEADPAKHLRYRKLATPAFRSRAIAAYEREGLAMLANELIDELGDREEFDLVEDFTSRFPYLVISRMLGLPREREAEFHGWALALLSFRDDAARAMEARETFSAFLAPIVESRRRDPKNDVISELVQAEVGGKGLTDEEILSHIRMLFPTGGETAYGSLSNLLYALLTQGDSWRRVVAEPRLIDAAVTEGLRWETPIAVLPRMSRDAPVEFEGITIPPNAWVLFAVAGANRDPALLDQPDNFDLDRSQPANLVFGRGVKSCPGMHLAKKNMSVATEVLAQRLPEMELLDADAAVPRRTVLRSPDALRVRRTG
ncbi:MAG: cytochrome P450 [Myxococcota bacterium]